MAEWIRECMHERLNNNPEINVRESDYKSLLGYPANFELQDRARELVNWAVKWYSENGSPWIYYLPLNGLEFSNDKITIDGVEFSSGNLRQQFISAKVDSVYGVIVSAGKELEEMSHKLWDEEKPDEYFFLEVYGSAVVENLIMAAGFTLCDWAEKNGTAVLPHYSPGYPGWKITDQKYLLDLINRKKKLNFPQDISVYETGMLDPKKSLLAMFGITRQTKLVNSIKDMIPCSNCSLFVCSYRRAPFKKSLIQLEDVRRMQSVHNEKKRQILSRDASYSINNKALQKWSKERLQIKFNEDNSVSATFRYQGSTCSNMGKELEFYHHIKLEPATNGYKIKDLKCTPAPGDTGHTFMCEYIKNPELINTIQNEKPLLGKPLDEILTWERNFFPEGCYCKPASRRHKWGLALEVLHFALVQHENQQS